MLIDNTLVFGFYVDLLDIWACMMHKPMLVILMTFFLENTHQVPGKKETIFSQLLDYRAFWCSWYFDFLCHHLIRYGFESALCLILSFGE